MDHYVIAFLDQGVREADTTFWAKSISGYFKWLICSL